MKELKRYTITGYALDPTAARFGPKNDTGPKEDPDGLWMVAADVCEALAHYQGFIEQKQQASSADEHPLVGMFLHTKKDGKIDRQGMIVFAHSDRVMIQFYSWLDGSRTKCETRSLKEIMSSDWIFYADADRWNEAGAKRMDE